MNKKIKEIKNKTEEELKDLLKTKKEDLFKLKMDKTQNKLKDVKSIYKTKKDIARILTLIRERELVGKNNQDKTQKEEKQL
jgi:large subunit ribosomal protein L29